NDPMDGNGHGTACAGIAAGDLGTVGDYIGGVAPGAKLYALKITYTATGVRAYTSDMVEAWDWCVDHQNDDPSNPIMVISMSFGFSGGRHTATCDDWSTALTTAASNAKAAGMTLFVSSGNDGYCDAISFPACITHVISVGAVYDANIGRHPQPPHVGCISNYSCAGYTEGCTCAEKCYVDETTAPDQVTTYSNSASFLDILAPSNHCTTTELRGGYWTAAPGFGGTSAACPYAAGAAACLQEAANDIRGFYLTPNGVQNLLTNTGDPITDPKVAITTPRVNLFMAVCGADNLNCVWVDFNYSGMIEMGLFDLPYNTLAEAVDAAGVGKTIAIKAGSSPETITITKEVTLRACGGTVTIGQ
ncbi:MAG: S8 family serine peptidase, partial [Candidatus Marinimicrobia bacterium]|nr:S8 family serine peptidase [Candidatus Neomarinimicrobiota bacterium]